MLQGNKFYKVNLNAPNVPKEDNYTDWKRIPSVGSSYTKKFYGTFYGDNYTLPQQRGLIRPLNPYINVTVPTNNPYRTIDNYSFALGTVGETPPERKGVGLGNALMTVLDLMQRPQFAITNILDEVTDKQKSSLGDVLTASKQGLIGQRRSSMKDTFANLNWEDDPTKRWWQGGNLGRNIAGFLGDVLLDPLTYLTGGTAALAKGIGTKAIKGGIKESLTDTLTKTNKEIMTAPSEEVIRDVASFIKGELGDPTKSIEEAEDFVLSNIKKHGEASNLVLRLTYALSRNKDVLSHMEAKKSQVAAKNLLTDGIGSINRDIIDEVMSNPLKQRLNNILATEELPKAQEALNRSVGQLFSKSFDKTFSFEKMEDKVKNLTIRNIYDVLNSAHTSKPTKKTKKALIKNIFNKTFNPVIMPRLADREFDVLDTLFQAFKVKDKIQATQLIRSARKIAKIPKLPLEKMGEAIEKVDEIEGVVRRIKDGIEFSNGIQRVFDVADNAFYIKYHNPFTGTIKPLLEITNIASSEKARAAWDTLVKLNPLSPFISKLGLGIANKFSTEYISKSINYLADGTVNPLRRQAAQRLSKEITKFMRLENALVRRSLEATNIFKSVPKFFEDRSLNPIGSIFIERNNSPIAKAAWIYLSGENPSNITDEVTKAAYHFVTTNPYSKRNLDRMKYDPSKFSAATKIAQQNLMFNEAIALSDGVNRISFARSLNHIPGMKDILDELQSTPYLQKAVAQEVDEETMMKYARIYNNTNRVYLNPVAIPSKTKRDIIKEVKETRLGSTADARAIATSINTGAFLIRKNASAMDALMENPTHNIDFDIATRVARRALESERVALNIRFIETLQDYVDNVPGFNTLVSLTREFEGSHAIRLMDGRLTVYAHPEIANQLSRIATVFDNASVASSMFDTVIMSIGNFIKVLQTKYNLSFVLRNAIGEPLMNWVGDVSMKSHFEAVDIINEARRTGLFKIGDTTFAHTPDGEVKKLFREYVGEPRPGVKEKLLEYPGKAGVKVFAGLTDIAAERKKLIEASGIAPKYYQLGARQMTATEIIHEFRNVGLDWSGVTKGNLAHDMQDMLEQGMLEITSKQGLGNFLKTMNEKVGLPGNAIEMWTRLSHYIDALKKGMDVQSAALEVRKYHVDYKDLTVFERRYMRNLKPYYTYMRKNFPIQVRALIERQNKVNIIGQLVDSMYEAVESDNQGNPLAVPDFLKEGLAIPLNVDDDGNVQYLNWGVPISDVGRFKYNLDELMMRNFFSMWTPLVKAPLEYTMNKHMMYGSDLEKYRGQGEDLFPGVEGSPRISTLTNQLIQSLGVLGTLRNAIATGMVEGTGAGAHRFITGSILPRRNQEEVRLQQAYQYRDQLYGHIQELRRKGVNVPQYTPGLQYNTPVLNPWAVSDRVEQRKARGYLGVPNIHLYPGLLRILNK